MSLAIHTRWVMTERRRGRLICLGETYTCVMSVCSTVPEAHQDCYNTSGDDISEKWSDSRCDFDECERCSCFACMLRLVGSPLIFIGTKSRAEQHPTCVLD